MPKIDDDNNKEGSFSFIRFILACFNLFISMFSSSKASSSEFNSRNSVDEPHPGTTASMSSVGLRNTDLEEICTKEDCLKAIDKAETDEKALEIFKYYIFKQEDNIEFTELLNSNHKSFKQMNTNDEQFEFIRDLLNDDGMGDMRETMPARHDGRDISNKDLLKAYVNSVSNDNTTNESFDDDSDDDYDSDLDY